MQRHILSHPLFVRRRRRFAIKARKRVREETRMPTTKERINDQRDERDKKRKRRPEIERRRQTRKDGKIGKKMPLSSLVSGKIIGCLFHRVCLQILSCLLPVEGETLLVSLSSFEGWWAGWDERIHRHDAYICQSKNNVSRKKRWWRRRCLLFPTSSSFCRQFFQKFLCNTHKNSPS